MKTCPCGPMKGSKGGQPSVSLPADGSESELGSTVIVRYRQNILFKVTINASDSETIKQVFWYHADIKLFRSLSHLALLIKKLSFKQDLELFNFNKWKYLRKGILFPRQYLTFLQLVILLC